MQNQNLNNTRIEERYCALIIGILYLIIGLAGFIRPFVFLPSDNPYIAHSAPLSSSSVYAAGFGYVFGLFPTNFFHNALRCAVGVFGIIGYITPGSARAFNRIFAISYAVLAIMGLLPFANTFFGLMPLFGNNVWVNALAAIATASYSIIIPYFTTSMATNTRVPGRA